MVRRRRRRLPLSPSGFRLAYWAAVAVALLSLTGGLSPLLGVVLTVMSYAAAVLGVGLVVSLAFGLFDLGVKLTGGAPTTQEESDQ